MAESVSPELVALGPQPEGGPVLEYRTVAGKTTEWHRVFTEEDRAEVADANDDYLLDAGVLAVPLGMAVYLTLPHGVARMDQLCELVRASTLEQGPMHLGRTALLKWAFGQLTARTLQTSARRRIMLTKHLRPVFQRGANSLAVAEDCQARKRIGS